MSALLPALQPLKDKLPRFILKLYHILEQEEYSAYMSWNGCEQIVIKQPKQVVFDKVLKHFFSLKSFSSFIRQLNIYNFKKVVKVIKNKHHMYFMNAHFKRGQIDELLQIKRQNNKTKTENVSHETISMEHDDQNISIEQQLHPKQMLVDYRQHVSQVAVDLITILTKIQHSHPALQQVLSEPLRKCRELCHLKKEDHVQSWMNWEGDPASVMPLPQPLFPSQNYL